MITKIKACEETVKQIRKFSFERIDDRVKVHKVVLYGGGKNTLLFPSSSMES